MTKFSTETGRTLVPEGAYEAMINNVQEKNIKGGYIIYEWAFEALVNGKPYHFGISLFSSQMSDLLKALGATEVTKNKFDWDSDDVIGQTISFNIVHVEDKKGVVREQLSDIKLLSNVAQPKKADEVQW